MRRTAKVCLAAATAGAIVAIPAVAQASFVRSTSAAVAASSDTLSGTGSVTLTDKRCGLLGLWPSSATISWTATPDTYATGYEVLVTKSGGTPVVTGVAGRSNTSATVSFGNFATYSITVRAAYNNWTSAQSTPVSVYCGLF